MRCFLQVLGAACLLSAAMSAPAADHTVIVGGGTLSVPSLGFSPPDITINVGDTITFRDPGIGPAHNVHADDGSFRCAIGCDAIGGNGDPAASWQDTLTFDHAGTITYRCDPHASMGMTGVIRVQDAGSSGGNVPITSGFTGAWYDPQQSGHGIFIEVLANNQILAWWFTFSPDGTQQSWFGNVGSIDISTNTATVDAIQTTGGRWIPNFNPADVTQTPWGTLTFAFSDCDHGRVDFTSSVPGYGSNHMDLTRITQPAGLSCP